MFKLEQLIYKTSLGLRSRFIVFLYKLLGMEIGKNCRFEHGRMRRATQIQIGDGNSLSNGYQLWPFDETNDSIRIKIGNNNYFNRNIMIDSCAYIEIGNSNMFGPDVYVTDSNHSFGENVSPKENPMVRGKVLIGNHCWIGAKAIILKDVELGDYCVVAAGAIVTKSFPAGSVVGGVPAKLLRSSLKV